MKALVTLLSRSVHRYPGITVVAVLVIGMGLSFFNQYAEQADANEGFAPEAEALDASERIGELFGEESSGSVLQIIVSSDAGDVVTADGAAVVGRISETLLASDLAADLQSSGGQPPVVSFLAPLEGAGDQGPSASIVISGDDVISPDGLAASQAVQQAVFSSSAAAKIPLDGDAPPVTSFLAAMEGAAAQGPSIAVVVRAGEGDVFTAEGLQSVQAVQGAGVATLGAKLAEGDQPPVTSYLLPVESAIAQGAAADLPTPGIKQMYLDTLPNLPPEIQPILGFLASNDADLAVPSASAGLVSFALTEPLTDAEVTAFSGALGDLSLPAGYSVVALPTTPTAADFKTVYSERLAFVPAEFAPFLDFLLSNDKDPVGPSASKGLVSVSFSEPLTASEEASLAEAIAGAALPAGFSAGYLPTEPTTEELKIAYLDRLSFIPADQAGLVENLLSGDRDLATPSATSGLMLIFLNSPDQADAMAVEEFSFRQQAFVDAIDGLDLADGYEAKGFSFELIFATGGDSNAEIGRMFGLAALIIVVILMFNYWRRLSGPGGLFRSVRRMLATMALTMFAIFFAISIMNGIGVLLGPKYLGVIGAFNQIVQILPILLIGLGVDYGIHMTSRYQEEFGHERGIEAATETAIRTVGVALILATGTTAVGFLTNLVSPVPALKDFGILAAVGIVVSFALMLTLVPAVRLLLDRRAADTLHPEDFAGDEAKGGAIGSMVAGAVGGAVVYVLSVFIEVWIRGVEFGDVFELGSVGIFAAIGAVVGIVIIYLPKIVGPTGALADRAAIPVVVIALLIGVLGYVGFQQLETKFSFTDFVPSDNPLLDAIVQLEDEFGGGFGETTSVLLEGDVASVAIHNAQAEAFEALRTTTDVVQFGDAPAVDSPVSLIASLIDPSLQTYDSAVEAQASSVGMGDDFMIPASADPRPLYAAAAAAAPDAFDAVVHRSDDGGYDAALWTINTQAGDSRAGELNDELNEVFVVAETAGATAIPTSQNIIGDVVVKSLQSSQVSSLWITLLAAMALLTVNFWVESRRPLLGVITMLPVVLVVLATFGTMAVTGIPFGPVTATISALAIGIAVPYTIHITHRFQEDRIRFESTGEAIRSTTLHTGGALAGSALTTMAGFGSLVSSNLKPFQQFGAVTFYAIAYALLFSLLVLPSMLVLWDRWHRRRGDETFDEAALRESLGI